MPSMLENTLLRNVQDGGSVLVATGTPDSHREHIPVYGGNVAGCALLCARIAG